MAGGNAQGLVPLASLRSPEAIALLGQFGYPPEQADEATARIVNEYEERPHQPILGFQSGGHLIALIGVRLQPPDPMVIRHIVVHQEWRGKGIGRRMIQGALVKYQPGTVLAETRRGAIGFHQRLGFTVESLGEKYPGTERFLCRWTAPPAIA